MAHGEAIVSNTLQGKRALVTGAARGIGRAISESLTREGARVAVHARNVAQLDETLEAIMAADGTAFGVEANLLDSGAIEAMCANAIERLGGIDIVVNNAGVGGQAALVDTDEATWDWTLDTNLKAPFLVTKHTLPTMIAQGTGGALIYNSSTAAKLAAARQTAYNASKAGLVALVRSLATEVGPHGIKVNAVCPGWTATEMATEIYENIAGVAGRPFAEVYNEGMRANMMGEIVQSEDVAELVAYLAGPGGRHITGQAINVCAGLAYT